MKDNISVIIPTYNRAPFVVSAVKSALAAIDHMDEIIVIDDGSTDDTQAALKPFYDKIRYIRTDNNGPGAARNYGIQQTRFPLVAFLDSDDEWFSDKLYLQRQVMSAYPQLVFCFSDLISRLPNDQIVHKILNIWRNDQWVGYTGSLSDWNRILGPGQLFSSIGRLPGNRSTFNVHIGNLYPILMEVYYVWTSSILVRKELAGDSFKFAEDRNICEDWECFARIARMGPAAYLDCELSIQHVHDAPRLTQVKDLIQVTERIKLLHSVWGQDDSFMLKHSERFSEVLRTQHIRRARYLIKEGRAVEARLDLKSIGGGPWSYRVLTSLPAPLINAILGMRRILIELGKTIRRLIQRYPSLSFPSIPGGIQ